MSYAPSGVRLSPLGVVFILAGSIYFLIGVVLSEDKTGNDGADELARAVTSSQAAPADILQRAAERRQLASAIQWMILRILGERFAADASGTAERDAGECILADSEAEASSAVDP